jgi:hypothetical protein
MFEPADRYGDKVVSWQTVWNDLFPEDPPVWHDDGAAAEMNRLRGLIAAQGTETEKVLGRILQSLDKTADIEKRMAGALLKDVKKRLRQRGGNQYQQELEVVGAAIERRNHAVHQSVMIGSSWVDYATGGEYDEVDLRRDLALQHRATGAAVTLLRALTFDGILEDDG